MGKLKTWGIVLAIILVIGAIGGRDEEKDVADNTSAPMDISLEKNTFSQDNSDSDPGVELTEPDTPSSAEPPTSAEDQSDPMLEPTAPPDSSTFDPSAPA